ncbi:MAG TPA: acetamidase/formamidase family protein [candidate division Zixibacteria bacterium]|nr:acetamidase/formamidase family protein [candidate division Zixibacteria bacterium]
MNQRKIHRVSQKEVVFKADRKNKPVLKVKSGDTVIFECRDAFNQVIKTPEDLPINFDMEHINPATGPVYIEGAEPGDTLEVHIEKIDLAEQGACCIIPNFGFIAEDFPEPWTRIIPIKDGFAEFDYGIKIPIDPFPGTIIVAPPEGAHGTLIPKEYGGNMDSKACRVGTTVYLPIFVQGALFGVGDVHAVQGDGEVCGTAVEIDADLTIKLVVNKEKKIKRPQYETDEYFMTTAWSETADEAAKIALRDMIDWLVTEKAMTREEAYALCSCAVDFRISQFVDVTPGVRAVLPKKIFIK